MRTSNTMAYDDDDEDDGGAEKDNPTNECPKKTYIYL